MAQHDGRVALITGGGAGIGLEIARQMAAEGAQVAVGARRFAEPDIAREVEERVGGEVWAGTLDVRDQGSIDGFMAALSERFGAPGVLVNSAGISVHQTVCGHGDAGWLDVIDTNLTGPFRMTRACLPAMISAGWGRIVNVASTAAAAAKPSHAAYCASKSGLLGLTRATALEGAPHGVSAVAVSPTWVETDMLRASAARMAATSGRTFDEEMAAIAAANPQSRLVQAGEIARLVSFLCSDAAPGLTMEDIQVNAGAHW